MTDATTTAWHDRHPGIERGISVRRLVAGSVLDFAVFLVAFAVYATGTVFADATLVVAVVGAAPLVLTAWLGNNVGLRGWTTQSVGDRLVGIRFEHGLTGRPLGWDVLAAFTDKAAAAHIQVSRTT